MFIATESRDERTTRMGEQRKATELNVLLEPTERIDQQATQVEKWPGRLFFHPDVKRDRVHQSVFVYKLSSSTALPMDLLKQSQEEAPRRKEKDVRKTGDKGRGGRYALWLASEDKNTPAVGG
jgi:hypothetical protein